MTPHTRPDATAHARHLALKIAEEYDGLAGDGVGALALWHREAAEVLRILTAATAAQEAEHAAAYDKGVAEAYDLGKRDGLAAQEAYRDKGERVFEAVVYAFEGRPVPDDLHEHGMVRRALKYRAAQEEEVASVRADGIRIGRLGSEVLVAEWRHKLTTQEAEVQQLRKTADALREALVAVNDTGRVVETERDAALQQLTAQEAEIARLSGALERVRDCDCLICVTCQDAVEGVVGHSRNAQTYEVRSHRGASHDESR